MRHSCIGKIATEENLHTRWVLATTTVFQNLEEKLHTRWVLATIQFLKTLDLLFANRPTSELGKYLAYNFRDMTLAPYGDY